MTAQYKKPREPFQIYESQYESRQQLDTLNGNRQPFLFNISDFCPLTYTTTLAELAEQNIIVSLIDNKKYYENNRDAAICRMPLKECISFIYYYPNYNYFANIGGGGNGNGGGGGNVLNTIAEEFNEILAPSMIPFMCSSKLSIIGGGYGGGDGSASNTISHTIPEYHTQTAKYVVVLSTNGSRATGDITIKLTSVRNYEKLNGGKCKQKWYANGGTQYTHFIGDVDIWNTDKNIKLQKIPFLQFNVGVGYAISIPPFTVWSIKFNQAETVVFSIDYISFINSIANIGNWWYSIPFNDNTTMEDDDDSVSTIHSAVIDNTPEIVNDLADADIDSVIDSVIDNNNSDTDEEKR